MGHDPDDRQFRPEPADGSARFDEIVDPIRDEFRRIDRTLRTRQSWTEYTVRDAVTLFGRAAIGVLAAGCAVSAVGILSPAAGAVVFVAVVVTFDRLLTRRR